MDPDDVLRDIASQDQGEAGAHGVAGLTLAYFDALRKGGMTRAEALEMTKVFIQSMVERGAQQQGGA